MKKEYEVIIVGAGVAGALLAWKLALRGVRVLLLEAGPGDDGKDGLQARLERVHQWSISYPKIPSAPYVNEDTPKGKRLQQKSPIPIVTKIRSNYYDMSDDHSPDVYKSNYERLVGGSTWHWLGNVPRLLPNDFKMKSRYGVAVDWPISYSDLEPYYVEAEHVIGVAGDHALWNGVHGASRSRKFPMQKVWECYGDSVIKRRLAGRSIRGVALEVLQTPQARNSEPFDNRPPCAGNSICVPICPIQAKYDATVHLNKALGVRKNGEPLVDLISRAVVSRLEKGRDGRIAKVHFIRWSADPNEADECDSRQGRIVILAAHAIESAKILLNSQLASSSDQLGRNLMDHLQGYGGAIMPEPVFPFRGPPTTSGIDAFRDGPFRTNEAAFRMSMGNDGWGRQESPYDTMRKLVRNEGVYGDELRSRIAYRVTRMFRISYSTEQLPYPDNRVELSDKKDGIGLRRPKITYRVRKGGYNRRGFTTARETVQQIFKFLEAEETDIRYPDDINYSGAGHIMGTCRMGSDPKTSVVDEECRTHDHPNLFVASSAVFPTGGTANPTLTVAALAMRAADSVLEQLSTEK